jgi:peptide/nickel transport system ATP-binding protein
MSLLEVRGLSVDYLTEDGKRLRAVEDVGFWLDSGRSLGLVGESGCGKTTTMLAVLRLLPAEGRIVSGQVQYGEIDLLQINEAEMRKYRWCEIAMVFQGAMNAFNPVRRIGDQIAEAILLHGKARGTKEANQRVEELLDLVGISPAMARRYPHEYSGGMRQRALIAMAISCSPKVLIADEPTTALDVMIQAQILELLQELQQELNLSIVLITHDLGVVAELCHDVLVMYGGVAVEYASAEAVFNGPLHPYTQRLLQAFPDVENPRAGLVSIPGYPPPLHALPAGCRFEPRCHRRRQVCASARPPLAQIRPDHYVACYEAGAW